MATQSIESARYCSGTHKIKFYGETASQTFKKGEFVYLDTDSQVTVCAANAVTILGMAGADASGTTSAMTPVIIAHDDTEFEINVTNAGTAVATANTNKDAKWAYYTTGNIAYCDIGDTDYDAFMITEIIIGGGRAVGDTSGRVKVVVIPAAQQLGAKGT